MLHGALPALTANQQTGLSYVASAAALGFALFIIALM